MVSRPRILKAINKYRRDETMKLNLSKGIQIQKILVSGNSGYDGWYEKYLPKTKTAEDYEFSELFSINENDVYQYVKVYDWDKSIVNSYERLPDPESNFATWLLLPKTEQGYHLATFGSWDRALWHEWYFETEEARDRFIIHQLFETQKSFWGKKPRF